MGSAVLSWSHQLWLGTQRKNGRLAANEGGGLKTLKQRAPGTSCSSSREVEKFKSPEFLRGQGRGEEEAEERG